MHVGIFITPCISIIVFAYMADMMPVLYNYVKVDIETFLSNPKHVEVVITMCKSVGAIFVMHFVL